MRLHILNSNSAGNGYILEAQDSCLLIEAGVHLREVKRALGFDLSKIKGCIVTHNHGDHAGHLRRYIQEGAIDAYASRGTFEEMGLLDKPRTHTLRPMQLIKIGDFNVWAFDVEHDTSEPFGYIIEHKECGKILFITDTMFLKYNFRNMEFSHLMVEANYCDQGIKESLDKGELNPSRAQRISESHMSIDTACGIIRANRSENLMNVILIHLSKMNSDEALFLESAQKEAPFAKVYAAKAGMKIDLLKQPF